MMERILIIEDELSIAELQKDYLEIHGFSVDIATDGAQGLATALTHTYDLIIVDLMLPHIDGFELCKRIRASSNIPILMVTARSDDIDLMRGLGLGADDYITKPFRPNELVARVKSHLARYHRLVSSHHVKVEKLHIRGLVINRTARQVHVNGQEVILRTKEFDLLAFLASHPNRVFTKEELYERVWGMEASGDSATVTVHIGKIREKIELISSNEQYIETVWGVGYRFRS